MAHSCNNYDKLSKHIQGRLSFGNDNTHYSVAGIPQSYLTGHEGCVDKDDYSHFKYEN